MFIKQFAAGISFQNKKRDNIRIGVLTYDVKHRKTFDTLCLLKAQGYKNIKVYAQPMTYQKKFEPYLKHRPTLIMNIPDIEVLCSNMGFDYFHGRIENIMFPSDMILLVCGAGIIPEMIWSSHVVINVHPGLFH